MKINELNIEKFAKDEYSNAAPHKVGINGRNLLIFGENRSGKTLTFNAILYCLLGSQETIELSTGRGNRVSLGFDDGIKFARGHPQAELDMDGDVRTGEQAIDQFTGLLGDPSLIKAHFIHSHIDRLPLSVLSEEERLAQIRSVTNNSRQQGLDWHTTALQQISDLLVESQDTLRRIEEDQPDITAQLASTEGQLEKHRTTQSLIESGQLERIRDQLLRDEDLNEELDSLFSEQEALRQELNRLNKRKRRHEGYSEEVTDIIAKAVNDFVCPACDRRVTTEKAKNRLDSGYCPYCGQEGSIQSVKDHIREKVENANEVVEDLEAEISDLQQRQTELEAEIDAVKAQRPELSNLDAAIKRKLRNHDYDISQVEEATQEDIQTAEDTLANLRETEHELAEQIETVKHRIEALQESQNIAEEEIDDLEASSYEKEIQEFAELWTSNYREMAGDLGLDIGITRSGAVIVPGGTDDTQQRRYDRRGDLSDSELRLLNISYTYTMNQCAVDAGVTDWRVFVLDEPFSNLDQESTEVLLDYFLSSKDQFIISTSDEEITDHFDDYHTITLSRGPMQTALGDFL